MAINGVNGIKAYELEDSKGTQTTKTGNEQLVTATEENGLDMVSFTNAKKTDEDVQKRINELKKSYTNANVQEFIDDDVVMQLSREGFTKEQAIQIVSQVMPGVITPLGGNKYTLLTSTPGSVQIASQLFGAYSVSAQEAEALENELVSAESEILKNNNDIEKLTAQIQELQKEIQAAFNKATDENEEIEEEHKADIKKATNQAIEEYANSNGEMTYEEFQANLQGKLEELGYDAQSRISQITSQMVAAESKMTTMAALVTRMGNLVTLNKNLGNQAQDKIDEFDELQDEIQVGYSSGVDSDATYTSPSESKDPIGFTSNGTTFDFFVDKDNNGDLSNANEFLGAENGFNEVLKLDTNSDGLVDNKELENANIKVVKTDTNGKQSIVDVSQVLQDEDGIDISSYQAKNEIMDNGNLLQGIFDMKYQGQTLDDAGYQTLDKMEWLNDLSNKSDKTLITISNNDNKGIERLNSPILFKIINGKVYIVARRIDEKIYGTKFSFKNGEQEGELFVPSKEKLREDFIDKFLEYCKDKLNNNKASILNKFDDTKGIEIKEI